MKLKLKKCYIEDKKIKLRYFTKYCEYCKALKSCLFRAGFHESSDVYIHSTRANLIITNTTIIVLLIVVVVVVIVNECTTNHVAIWSK